MVRFLGYIVIMGEITYLWLARNEGMDVYSSPYRTHYSSCSFSLSLIHSQLTNFL